MIHNENALRPGLPQWPAVPRCGLWAGGSCRVDCGGSARCLQAGAAGAASIVQKKCFVSNFIINSYVKTTQDGTGFARELGHELHSRGIKEGNSKH